MTSAERELFQRGLEIVQGRGTVWSPEVLAAAQLAMAAERWSGLRPRAAAQARYGWSPCQRRRQRAPRPCARLHSSGGLVIAGTACLWNRTNAWQEAVKAVPQRWLGAARRAGSSTYAEPADPFEAVIARSPFSFVETYRHEYQLTRGIEGIRGPGGNPCVEEPARMPRFARIGGLTEINASR